MNILRWWLFFCLSIAAAVIVHYFGFFTELYEKDQTKLSFAIVAIYFASSIFVGKLTLDQSKSKNVEQNISVGWFLSETMLALGMIGTVAGFILMLGESFADIDTSNAASLKDALSAMALGMSTALYTTLVGLICSQLLKIQLINAETGEQ